MGVNACECYVQHKMDTVLAKAGPGDTVCQVCKQDLKTTQNLRAHIISKHMKAKSPYKCQVCEETFGSAHALKLHLRKHCQFQEVHLQGLRQGVSHHWSL